MLSSSECLCLGLVSVAGGNRCAQSFATRASDFHSSRCAWTCGELAVLWSHDRCLAGYVWWLGQIGSLASTLQESSDPQMGHSVGSLEVCWRCNFGVDVWHPPVPMLSHAVCPNSCFFGPCRRVLVMVMVLSLLLERTTQVSRLLAPRQMFRGFTQVLLLVVFLRLL